jgi:hypothetical protein
MQSFTRKPPRSITHHKRRNSQGDIERHFNFYTEEKALKTDIRSCCLQVIPDVSAPVLDSGLLKGKTPNW